MIFIFNDMYQYIFTMKNVICFVLSTEKYVDRIERIERTWSKNVPTIFYSDHDVIERNIIKVHDEKNYRAAEMKQYKVLNSIKKMSDVISKYDWICFTDDDTFLNVKKLNEIIQTLDETKSYGEVLSYQNDPRNPMFQRSDIPKDLRYPNGGSGFLISVKTINQIPEFKSYDTGFSDVTFGLNLYFNGVYIEHCDLFHRHPPSFYNHNIDQIKKNISYHYILNDDGL